MPGIGTLINVITVIIGGSFGLLIGGKISEGLENTVMKGLGLITLVIGIDMALGTKMIFIPMGSVVVGGMIGHWLDIAGKLDSFGDFMKVKSQRVFKKGFKKGDFSKGFVTASLVFCVGPMTVLGSIQDGLSGDFSLLAVKAGLDGFAAMAFASTMGVGVLFSVITLIVYQGGLTMAAAGMRSTFAGMDVSNSIAINELSATGGVLIIGIGLLLLEIADVKVSNYLPAIFIAPLLVFLLQVFGVSI